MKISNKLFGKKEKKEEIKSSETNNTSIDEAKLPLWEKVSHDLSQLDSLILEKLQKSMCFMVRDENGPVSALITRGSSNEFREPINHDTKMSLYIHHYKAPAFDLFGIYPIIWDDPNEPFFKETWMSGATPTTGKPDPLKKEEFKRLNFLLNQNYTYFLVVNPSNQIINTRKVSYSKKSKKHFKRLLTKLKESGTVSLSKMEYITGLQDYLNSVSLEEIRASARKLR